MDTHPNPVQRVPRILAVEDDPDMVALLKAMWGDDVEIACVGTLRQACIALEMWTFDVVLLDIGLPDGDGTHLLEDMRAGAFSEANRSIPVVMVTASRNEIDYEVAWELDTLAYVQKPVSIPVLRDAVSRCLSR